MKDLSLQSEGGQSAYRSPLLRPWALLAIWVGVGWLFSFQEYAELRNTHSAISLFRSMELWAIYSLISACGFLLARSIFGQKLQTSSWQYCLTHVLPFSLLLSTLEGMLYVAIWPYVGRPQMHHPYWTLVDWVMRSDFVTNLAFFWIAIFIARGIGYYERYRAKELSASRLQTEVVNARMQALQMQLNPHFLFNTMNGISGLIHVDPDAADRVLEQLARLLRMTLDRGELQRVPLREEIEFIQAYLEIQQTRFGPRVRYGIELAPETWDALIPTMILQPIVENAYRHGLATTSEAGMVRIEAHAENEQLIVTVTNTGTGLKPATPSNGHRTGIGISNVKARLQLHYENNQQFSLRESAPGLTQASITLPFNLSDGAPHTAGKLLT